MGRGSSKASNTGGGNTFKKISAAEAKKILKDRAGDDGTTFYAIDEKTNEVYEFDSKKERDSFLEKRQTPKIETPKTVDFTREADFDYSIYNKLPKKLQVKNITGIDKYKSSDGTRYSARIKFDDGFTRSISEYGFADFKGYLEDVLKNKYYSQ